MISIDEFRGRRPEPELLERRITLKAFGGISMSHSRSKGNRQQRMRHQESSQEWNRSRNPSSMQYSDEQERYANQGGYGGSQGVYGSQGGYRSVNYADRFGNPGGESEFQGSREYRESPRYGQQDWRSQESRWRPDEERMPQYREGPPERGYPEWGVDTETDDMNPREWESGRESARQPERLRDNITRFGQRRQGQSGSQSGFSPSTAGTMGRQRQSFAGRGPQGYKRSDDRISEDINEELTQDPELDASDVSIEVKNGEVILKGTVPDRESKRRAEDIVESCSGVKEVLNQLRIKREGSGESDQSSQRDKSEDKRNKVAS